MKEGQRILSSLKKDVALNSVSSLIYQLVTVCYGFITRRLIISHYGSEMNGWLTSIITFLSLISICEFGIGSVIKANFYKPLYEKDKNRIDAIFKSTNRFFYRIGCAFLAYTVILIFVFPLLKSNSFGFSATALMIIIVSIGTFSQYFFGMSSQLLLEADQKAYICNFLNILSSIIVIASTYLLIRFDFSLFVVRLVYAIVFSIRPVCVFFYTKNKYIIETKDVHLEGEPIKQKWNGFTLHIAQMVQNKTDPIILSAFSTALNVSIYSVYHLVTHGLYVIVNIFSHTLTPVFGRIYASDNELLLRKHFGRFEWLMHSVICIVFGTCAIAIVPFVKLYTHGIADADYAQRDFGIMISLAMGLYCLTQIYMSLIYAAGKFKETQKAFIIEPIVNLIISIIAVNQFGLIGVLFGTIVSLIYKELYLVLYLRKNIVHKEFKAYIKLILLDGGIITSLILCTKLMTISSNTYITWALSSSVVFLSGSISAMVLSFFLFSENMLWAGRQINESVGKIIHKKRRILR